MLPEDPMDSLFALADVTTVLPLVAVAGIAIVGMRMQGVLTDEVMAELQMPFSRATLTVLGAVVIFWQLICIASQL
jgi:phosphoglycerol transferase MdoB-like AlkP superfamily enzyme